MPTDREIFMQACGPSNPWDAALDEWNDGPRTMKATADWANRWVPTLRTDEERRRIALTGAIATARAEGYRAGIERAAQVAASVLEAPFLGPRDFILAAEEIPHRIRALAPAPDTTANLAKATDPRGSEWSGGEDATEAARDSWECLEMVAATLRAHGCDVDLKGSTPPMFLNDAVHNALAAKNRDIAALRESLAFCYWRGVASWALLSWKGVEVPAGFTVAKELLERTEPARSTPPLDSTPPTGGLLSPDSASIPPATGATLPPTEPPR